MSKPVDILKEKLRELFQLDRGDLDFGIYRILAQKKEDVEKFLDEQLFPQVSELLKDLAQTDTAYLIKRVKEDSETAKGLGFKPEDSPEIQSLNKQLDKAKNRDLAEADVYNHLYNFFSRYYDKGDFMSLRRYKAEGKEAYLIPFNGEEVKLHWANADQYYIKTAENYVAYVFAVDSRRVRFEVAEVDAEKDNIKEANGNQRRFVLAKKDTVGQDNDNLVVRFEHRPLTANEKKLPHGGEQKVINAGIEKQILKKLTKLKDWEVLLSAFAPTEQNGERTILRKHIDTYTAKNEFDYFIHKDLGGFLRRELESYIKSEVLFLENLERGEDVEAMRTVLAQIKAIRAVGDKIIDFLEQIENFQKQLWLKKKFVLETNYCVTLDKVPEELYATIIKNKAQCDEWVGLYSIDKINGDLVGCSYSKPLKKEFLKENPYLVLDTKHFDQVFIDRLLAALSETAPIDEQMNGLLVHGENFQALNLLQGRYKEQVQCIYIDPPYNTESSKILYKNDYKNSSWLTMMENRLLLAKEILRGTGILCCAIDDEEVSILRQVLQYVFPHELGTAVVRSNPAGRKTKGKLSPSHEYALFFGSSDDATPGSLKKTEKGLSRYPLQDQKGRYAWANFVRSGSGDRREDRPKLHYPIFINKENKIRIPKMEWNEDTKSWDLHESLKQNESVLYPYRQKNGKKVASRWHRGHSRIVEEPDEYKASHSKTGSVSIHFKTRMDETSMPNTWWGEDLYASSNHGTNELKKIFGTSNFDFSKAPKLVEDCIRILSRNEKETLVLDYFAGSGTTGYAVINLNREDDGNRKYILVEIGHHFDTVLLPRMKKAIYSDEWKDGKPQERNGLGQLFRYVRLESYEDTLDSIMVRTQNNDLLSETEYNSMMESYQWRYALGVETAHNASLLGEDFINPFGYTLSVVREGVRCEAKVDLAETFNFLIGLRLKTRHRIDDVLAITGMDAESNHCLILWRHCEKITATKLNAWFTKHRKKLGSDFDKIYINGDHTLNSKRTKNEYWEAITIEPVFRKLMFSETK